MNTKFTPGPWSWDGEELIGEGGFLVLSAGIGKSGGAYLSINKEDKPLFAAAPELYESLLNMVGLFDNAVERRRWAGKDGMYEEAIETARSALAKAEGRS